MKAIEKQKFIRQWRVEFWDAGYYHESRDEYGNLKKDILGRPMRQFFPKNPPSFELALTSKFPETNDEEADAKVVGEWAAQVKRESWPTHEVYCKIQRLSLCNA